MLVLSLLLIGASAVLGDKLVVVPSTQGQAVACKTEFKGRFGDSSIYLAGDECRSKYASPSFDRQRGQNIVGVRQAEVVGRDSVAFQQSVLAMVSARKEQGDITQIVMGKSSVPELIRRTEDALFYLVGDGDLLEQFLPSDSQLYRLPEYTIPSVQTTSKGDDRLAQHFPVQFNPSIEKYIQSISTKTLRNIVRYLSGEDPKSDIKTRHSFTDGARRAAHWLKSQYTEAGFACELHDFHRGFSPNVACLLPRKGNPKNSSSEIVLIGAHYDSRGTFGQVRAGGGDDDGSGSAALLSIAKAIHSNDLTFEREVLLVAFAGEEQGLVGSRALAKHMKDHDRDIALMIQMDMLAYRLPDEPMQLGFPEIGSQTAIQLVGNITNIYVPQLSVGVTPACCSDHQSFHELNYPAVHAFERNGPIVDPMYHNSGDVSDRDGYDFHQLRASTQAIFATLLEVAKVQ